MAVNLKEILPLILGTAVGAASPQAGQALAGGVSMMDAFKQRRRRQGIEDEQLRRARAYEARASEDQEWQRQDRELRAKDRERQEAASAELLATLAPDASPAARAAATLAPANFASSSYSRELAQAEKLSGTFSREQADELARRIQTDPDNPHFGRTVSIRVSDGDRVYSETIYPLSSRQSGMTPQQTVAMKKGYIDAITEARGAEMELKAIQAERQSFASTPADFQGLTGQSMGQSLMSTVGAMTGTQSANEDMRAQAGRRIVARQKNEADWAEREAEARTRLERSIGRAQLYASELGLEPVEDPRDGMGGGSAAPGAGRSLAAEYGAAPVSMEE